MPKENENEFFGLFTWESWESFLGILSIQFNDCVWTSNFGPWKTGDRSSSIYADFENFKFDEFDGEGNKIRTVPISLRVKNENENSGD